MTLANVKWRVNFFFFCCARPLKEPSNYLSRISYSRIRGQVTNDFHALRVCVCVHAPTQGMCTHGCLCVWDLTVPQFEVCRKRDGKFFYFPQIILRDLSLLHSHPRQLWSMFLRCPGHVDPTYLLKVILSPYSSWDTSPTLAFTPPPQACGNTSSFLLLILCLTFSTWYNLKEKTHFKNLV